MAGADRDIAETESAAHEAVYPPKWRANIALALLVAAYILSYLDRNIIALMVDPIKQSLAISDFQVSVVQGLAFALFFSIAGVPLGFLADRMRRTTLIAIGITLWSLMTIACGLAGSFGALFFARVGVGIGEAVLAPAGYSLLADSFRPKYLVRAIAIFSMGGLLGSGLAYLVGGMLLDYLGSTPPPLVIAGLEPWQLAFIVVALPALVLVPCILALPEPKRRGATDAPAPRFFDTVRYIYARRRDFGPLYGCATLLAVANYSGAAWFPTHIMRTFRMAPLDTGLTLGILQLTCAVVGTFAGAFLTEKLQRNGHLDAHLRTVIVTSCGAAIGLLAPFMPTTELALGFWALAIVCLSGYFGSIVAALQVLTPNNRRGANSALMILIQTLGGLAVGTLLVGALADFAFSGMPSGIGISLSCIGITATIASALWGLRGLPSFRVAMGKSAVSSPE